jgi:outer membrane immunogenic protein
MRIWLFTAVMVGVAQCAHAADMPDFLRGSLPPVETSRSIANWDGWYVGGDVGYVASADDFSKSLSGLTNFIYRNTVLQGPTSGLTALNKANTQGAAFGAFVGRNFQWDQVLVGAEVGYSYMQNLSASAKSSIGPILYPGEAGPPGITYTYGVSLIGSAAAQLKDMMTFRGRAGWICDDFMPYMFGGLAVGRMDVARGVTSLTTKRTDVTTTDAFGNSVTIIGTPVVVGSLTTTQSQQRTNNFVPGWTVGLGFEYRLLGGLFMRAEYEHVGFAQVENTNVTLNNVRAGLGYKF